MHGEALRLIGRRGLQLGENAAWRLTLSPSSAAHAEPRARLGGPGAFRRFMLAGMASISYPGTQAEQLLLAPQELQDRRPELRHRAL